MNNIETIQRLFHELQEKISSNQKPNELQQIVHRIREAVMCSLLLPPQSHISDLIASMSEIETSAVK